MVCSKTVTGLPSVELALKIYWLPISLSDLCTMANEAKETFGILVEALSNLQDVSNRISLPKVYSSVF